MVDSGNKKGTFINLVFVWGRVVLYGFVLPAKCLACRYVFFLLLSLPLMTLAAPPSASKADEFVVGAISGDARKHIEFTQRLADYLAENLDSYHPSQGRVVVSKDAPTMGKMLKAGQVDLVSETLFTALELQEKYGAEILLKRWKKGVESYSSVIFVRQDFDFQSLDDLRGKVIAFEDRFSTSGFFIPAGVLLKKGYKLIELDSPNAPVPHDGIGYVFVKELVTRGNEISIASWVSRGIVHAGAFSDVNWNDTEDMPDELRKELVIIYQSQDFPRSLQLTRTDLEPQIKLIVKRLLLKANQTAKGKKALKKYQKTTKFQELDGKDQEKIALALEFKRLLGKHVEGRGVNQ